MPYCAQCQRSDIAGDWEFCPRCGVALTASPAAPARPPTDVKEMLIDFAWTAAEQFVKGRVQQKLGPLAEVVDQFFGSPPNQMNAAWPEWYANATTQQQPQLDPAELVRVQADEITKARVATQMARAAIDTSKSINSTLTRWS
jgi:hypothetical protein